MATMEAVKANQKIAMKKLHGVEGIRGIGITWNDKGEPCLKILVDMAAIITEHEILNKLGNIPAIVERIGYVELEAM